MGLMLILNALSASVVCCIPMSTLLNPTVEAKKQTLSSSRGTLVNVDSNFETFQCFCKQNLFYHSLYCELVISLVVGQFTFLTFLL